MNGYNTPPRPVGPRWARQLLYWFCAPHRVEEMEGDLYELFQERVKIVGLRKARWRYVRDVLSLMRPSMIKRQDSVYPNPATTTMLRNYLKIALRNLIKNKAYSAINIGGLAVGMAVAMLIGLWLNDELSVNKSFQHYDRIAQVMRNRTVNGETDTKTGLPIPLAQELQATYGDNRNDRYRSGAPAGAGPFRHVVLAWWTSLHTIALANQVFQRAANS